MQQFLTRLDDLKTVLAVTDSIFLVTGKLSYETSGAKELLRPLLGKRNVTHFNAFTPNPKINDIKKAVDTYRRSRSNLILAIGGGSVMDMAKATFVLSAQTSPMFNEIVETNNVVRAPRGRLIAVPTTAGSGAESTHFATVYLDDKKFSLSHPKCLPEVVVLEPQLVAKMPSRLAATSGMDAITHAIESFWSVKSTRESRNYSQKALKKILPNIVAAVCDGNLDARAAMLDGANLAGRAINIARTTACHALSYGMTAYYGIPHGQAVGLTLPLFMRFNSMVTSGDCQDSRGSTFVRDRVKELAHLLDTPNAESAKTKIEQIMESIGIEKRIRVSVDPNLLIETVNGSRLFNNPRRIEPELIGEILLTVSV